MLRARKSGDLARWAAPIPIAAALFALATAAASAQGISLATLGPEGAATPGDRMTVSRPFGTWTLQCDLSVTQNKRLCAVEQILQRPGGAVLWRLARASDNRNVLVWSLPTNLDTAQGLTVRLDGFSTTVTGWTCQTACLAILPITGILQSLLFSAAAVEMTYVTNSGKAMVLSGTMTGFKQAIQAAAEDPFAKRVPVAAATTTRVSAARVKKPQAPKP